MILLSHLTLGIICATYKKTLLVAFVITIIRFAFFSVDGFCSFFSFFYRIVLFMPSMERYGTMDAKRARFATLIFPTPASSIEENSTAKLITTSKNICFSLDHV